MTTKTAIELQPDDEIERIASRPRIALYRGFVQSTTVVDDGVQINYRGGTTVTVPEDEEIQVNPLHYVGDDEDED